MKKVLIAEDNPDSLEIITFQMEMMGYSVIAAKHGQEAVEKAVEEEPQLIVMDIMMPKMDCREVTRIIRSNPKTQNIPILASTVLFRESDLKSCIDAGCNDYITKPFTLKQLQGKIQSFIPSA